MIEELGVALDARGNVKVDENKMTSVPGVFSAGDMSRGQSLIVWAIAEGREAARGRRQAPDGCHRPQLVGVPSTTRPHAVARAPAGAHRSG